ncbi:MAG: peptidoglycan-binding domain-containing protein [Microscillaceae bacterium]|nr:peptidoglycan-binding domain-containing protein [Microscillaceae bacterium]
MDSEKIVENGESSTGRVKIIQQMLNALGYNAGPEDDWFGPRTERALMDFQKICFVNGRYDNATQKALEEIYLQWKESQTQILSLEKIPITNYCLDLTDFFNEEYPKTQIVLHLNCGVPSAYYTIQYWRNLVGRIGTAFVISGEFEAPYRSTKDGQIFRAFDEKKWAYNTGAGDEVDQRIIAIEICNWGPLYKYGDKFYAQAAINQEIPYPEVYDLGYEFRGVRYWHRITTKQWHSVKLLLGAISKKYEIDISGKYDQTWSDYDPKAVKGYRKGVLAHSSFIPESVKNRWDMPSFPELLEILNGF